MNDLQSPSLECFQQRMVWVKHTLWRNISAGHSQNLGKTRLTDSVAFVDDDDDHLACQTLLESQKDFRAVSGRGRRWITKLFHHLSRFSPSPQSPPTRTPTRLTRPHRTREKVLPKEGRRKTLMEDAGP